MEKITSKKSLMLLSVGIFIIAASLIIPHFVMISDLSRGLIVGMGLGMLLLALSPKRI